MTNPATDDEIIAEAVRLAELLGLTRTVIFFREDTFYPIMVRANEDLNEHARLNPGTLRIEDVFGKVLWPEGTAQ